MARITLHQNFAVQLFEEPRIRTEIVKLGEEVAARARDLSGSRNAETGILLETGTDGRGPFAKVGFTRRGKGFYLRFLEFGTVKMRARPMLLPALREVFGVHVRSG